LLALKKLFFPQISLPKITKYVGKDIPFEWEKYLQAVKNVARFEWDCEKLSSLLSKVAADREFKVHQHFHSTSYFIWLYAKKCGNLNNGVSYDEFHRAMARAFYDGLDHYSETAFLQTKVDALP
jgi:hypothetical protein